MMSEQALITCDECGEEAVMDGGPLPVTHHKKWCVHATWEIRYPPELLQQALRFGDGEAVDLSHDCQPLDRLGEADVDAAVERDSSVWIIQLEGSSDPQHFGPFADEDEALAWGFDNLADFEPEDWEPYELSLKAPTNGREV